MIELRNISISYKDKLILNNVSLDIKNNGLYLISGESGAGKTTLFNIISNIEYNYTGSRVVGEEITQVFDDYKLFENLSVLDNLKLVNNSEEIDYYLDLFKIKELKKVKVKYLSGGEKQRVSLIRCLLLDTKIMLLDEITSSLDYDNALFLMQFLKELSKTKIVVIISHDERFNDFYNVIYKLEDTKLKLIKNEKIKSDVKQENKENKKNIIYLLKNTLYNFKYSIVSYLMILIVMLFLSFVCFYMAPILINNFKEVKQNYNTTTFYFDVNIYDENATGYHEYYLEEIQKLEGFVGFEYVHNISEFIIVDKVYLNDMYLNYNYLTYYNNKNMDHLNEITDVVVSSTYTNNMILYDAVGVAPSNENEIAIGTDLALLYFNTTNMQEVVGKQISLDFINSEGETYTKDYVISGVYETPPQDFDNIYGQVEGQNTLILNSIQMYHPTYNELNKEKQQYLTTLVPLKDINDGYYSFAFTMKTQDITDELLVKLEALNETDVVSANENNDEETFMLLKNNLIFLGLIIIFGVILCVLTSLISMRYRKIEYAKYYLCGYKTKHVVLSISLEYIIYALIILPLVIIASSLLYNYFIEDLIYSNLSIVIILIIILVIIVVLLSALIVGFINRYKKALNNLKGEL